MQAVALLLQRVRSTFSGGPRLCTLQIELPQAHKVWLHSYGCLMGGGMRLREGKTRMTVLLDLGTRAKGANCDGFWGFTKKNSSQSSRIDRLEGKKTGKLSLCRSRGNR